MNGISSATVLNAIRDTRGNVIEWKLTVLPRVHMERKQAESQSSEAFRTSTIIVWKKDVQSAGLQCVSKSELCAAEDNTSLFSLDPGEYIIPGICTTPPAPCMPVKAFLAEHDVMKITSLSPYHFGGLRLRHWEVSAV